MTVSRSQRTYPLTLTADSLNTGIVSAYDWAAEDGSTTLANGKDHSGGAHHWTAPGTAATIVDTGSGKGVDPSVGKTLSNNAYGAANWGTLGLAVGTGDFTMWFRIRMPSAKSGSNLNIAIARFTDAGGTDETLYLWDVSSSGGWHWGTNNMTWSDGPVHANNAISDIHIRRISGVLKIFVNGVLKKTAASDPRDFAATTGAACALGCYTGQGQKIDPIFMDTIFWSRGISDAEVVAHQANPYSFYANAVAADSITVSTPASDATLPASISIAGTYAGGSTVTSIEASFNSGAYATISASPTGGTFSGSLTGQAAGNGVLTVRSKNGATVVATTTVTNITVVTDAIAFTVPNTAATAAVPFRMFQRDGANQATVRFTGAYIGTPTSIQYQWDGGTWTTLVASPTGGVFDVTLTLQGPAQGAFSIRFSNSTGIMASLVALGVGDVYMCMGQSNHVGQSSSYVPAVAPAAHPGWVTTEYDKSGVWRQNVEASGTPFDSTGQGSYFGRLATLIMETGVPVAFVPCSIGSTQISGWVPGQAYYDNSAAKATLIGAHKGVLWWQGEQDANIGTAQATYEAALNSSVNDWCTTKFPGKKWVVMNINNVQLDATNAAVIRAAIANVGATNPRVGAVGDMLGRFSNTIHYGTGGPTEVTQVADTAFTAVNATYAYSTVIATSTTLTLQSRTGAIRASLTGLKWAFFDQVSPGLFATPVAKGVSASTNGSGVVTVAVTGTTLPTGSVGWLVLTNSDGTVNANDFTFSGPVTVT